MRSVRKLARPIVVVAALSLTVAATAGAGGDAATSRHNAATPPFVIGVSNVSVANTFRVQMIDEIKYWGAHHPKLIKNVIVTDAGGDASKQISDIQDLVAKKVNALLVAPASATALSPTVNQAVAAGIPVVVFNSDLKSNKVSARAFPPYHTWAGDIASWLVSRLHGKGDVVALRGIAGLAAEADEWAGAQAVLKAHPGIHLVCTEYANWDYGAAKTAVANCLANHPHVDGVLSLGDAMTWAAAQVLQQDGYDATKIPMVGIGGSNGFLKYWKASKLNAYVIADPTNIGVTALKAALSILKGKKVPSHLQASKFVITNTTLAKFVKPRSPDSAWVGTELPDSVLTKLLGH